MKSAKNLHDQPLLGVGGKDVIPDISSTCLLMRTRLISRVITGIYDEKLRPFRISSAQFALLVVIYQVEPAKRAKIGRLQHQDRSTQTRNLKVLLSEGWVEERRYGADGRSRPIGLTSAGKDLLHKAEPSWRAAQVQAKGLLGMDGVIVVMDIAERIMDPTA
jgi:DNA-binding MarR family transcriptional regulator